MMVAHSRVADFSEDEHRQARGAADRLWQEIKRAVAEEQRRP